MDNFPFELVYEHFAKVFCEQKITKDSMPPMMACVNAIPEKIMGVAFLDNDYISSFFSSVDGKERLGHFLRKSVTEIGNNSFCIVLITEVFYKVHDSYESAKDGGKKESLSDDPESLEGIMISIYRPDQVQVQVLPFDSNGVVTYRKFSESTMTEGRLTLNPDDPERSNVH